MIEILRQLVMRKRGSRRRQRRVHFECLEARRLLAAIRFAAWNTLNNPDTVLEDADFSTVLEAIGNESVGGVQQPIDVLSLQETDFAGSSGSIGRIENIFDSLYPTVDYASVVTTLDGGGDATGFVYNTSTVTLLENTTVPGSLTHRIMRAKFRPVGITTMDRDFFAYSVHLKAGNDPSDATRRGLEATILRNDADALGEGANIIFTGDLNLQSSFEVAWGNLTSAGNGQLFDPINRPGSWHNNNAFKDIHTQNPQNNPQGGFMDDRFDFQLISNELTDGGGIEYIPGSYRAFGNNGTHSLNGPITSGSGASPAVLSALAAASDHLPVVVDYDIGALAPSVRITESGGATSVTEGGATDTYTVVLGTVPTSDVTVTLSVDSQLDLGAGPGVPVNLTFTNQNALTPQLVTVAAVDDLLVESQHSSTITHSTASLDGDYNALPGVDDVLVAITDNDTSVVISEIMANPLSDELAPGRGEWIEIVNTGSGTVDLSNWRFDDEDSGPDQDWGLIPNGTTLDVNQVAVFFDAAFTTEAQFRSEWSVPSAAKVIGLAWGELNNNPSSTNEVLQLLDNSGTSIDIVNYDDAPPWPLDNPSGPSIYLEDLAFNNNFGQNWSRSVVGVESAVAATGPTFDTGDIGSPGNAPGISGPQVVLSVDDVQVNEDAGTAIFTISANQAPTASVMVDYATADGTATAGDDYTAVSGTATISAMATSTTVVVNIADDLLDEDAETFQLNLFNPSAGAVTGDALGIGTILDNDTAGVTLVESGGSTHVTEGGPADSFTLALDTLPASDVTVTITPDGQTDLGNGAGIPVTRVFTSSNGTTAQTVDVTAVDDALVEGNHTSDISFSLASSDTNYNNLNVPDVIATVADNDTTTAITLTGETETFTGPGTYTLDFFVTASGGPQTIAGFNAPLLFDVPGVTFGGTIDEFTPNPAFELEFVTALTGANTFGVAASTGPGLSLADGQTELLFSVDVVADSSVVISTATVVSSVVTSGPDAINLQFFDDQIQPIPTVNVGGGATLEPLLPGIELTAEIEEFGGPGTYSLDFFVTANNGPQTIVGYNVPLFFGTSGVTFGGTVDDFAPNPAFALEFVAPLTGVNAFGVAASTGPGLSLADGQTEWLFTVDVVADSSAAILSPEEVVEVITSGPDAINLQVFDELVQPITNISISGGGILTPAVAPRIVDVVVAGSSWTAGFIDSVDGSGAGAGNGLGLSLAGPDQLRNLPWTNIDRIYIDFDEDIGSFDAADYSLGGVLVADYELEVGVTASYDQDPDGDPQTPGSRVTLALAAPVGADRLLLTIPDTVGDLAGNDLDGEWTDAVSLMSGNGSPGGLFSFQFEVLPGDVNDSGGVFADDLIAVNAGQFTFAGVPSFDPFLDLNGSGSVLADDIILVNGLQFTFLPPGSPVPPPPSIAELSVVSELRTDRGRPHRPVPLGETLGDRWGADKTDWQTGVDEAFSNATDLLSV